MIPPDGFEPTIPSPRLGVLGLYTTGVWFSGAGRARTCNPWYATPSIFRLILQPHVLKKGGSSERIELSSVESQSTALPLDQPDHSFLLDIR